MDRKLEEFGFEIIDSNGHHLTVFAAISSLVGDNLGRHTIFGLFESFRARRFCETCMVTNDEIQTKFHSSDFELREKNDYENQLNEISKNPQLQSEYGIKSTRALNQTAFYHFTKNRTGDLMHGMEPLFF